MNWDKIELQVYVTLFILLLAGVAILIDSKGVALMTVGFMILFIMFLQDGKNIK